MFSLHCCTADSSVRLVHGLRQDELDLVPQDVGHRNFRVLSSGRIQLEEVVSGRGVVAAPQTQSDLLRQRLVEALRVVGGDGGGGGGVGGRDGGQTGNPLSDGAFKSDPETGLVLSACLTDSLLETELLQVLSQARLLPGAAAVGGRVGVGGPPACAGVHLLVHGGHHVLLPHAAHGWIMTERLRLRLW